MVTGKRPKDLHSLDRSDLGGNTRSVRLGLCPLSERGAAAALHPACSCRGFCSLARTRHSPDPVGRDRELAQAQATWLGDRCRIRSGGSPRSSRSPGGSSAAGCSPGLRTAVLFGAAVLWTGEIITTILNFSPTWRDVMVRLVNAWGYAG